MEDDVSSNSGSSYQENDNLSNQPDILRASKTTSTCCAQYRQTLQNATDETNPDELASYFEQLLYIPKPMSLMAEMMYA